MLSNLLNSSVYAKRRQTRTITRILQVHGRRHAGKWHTGKLLWHCDGTIPYTETRTAKAEDRGA
jgi:hypothetical protein